MNPNDDNREDHRLAELLALSGRDAPPPDGEFLDRLRRQSAEVFAAEAAGQSRRAVAPADQGPDNRGIEKITEKRRHRMLVYGMRVLAGTLAATIVAAVALVNSPKGDDSALALADVLERTAGAKTLHLKIVRQGKTSEVFARRPQELRWNDADGTYRIARGPKAWHVDEKANRATVRPAVYFAGEPARLDLMAMLDLPPELGRGGLSEARPTGRTVYQGRTCEKYYVEIPWQDGKAQVEALVDSGTQMLDWLEVKHQRGSRVEPLARLEVVSLNAPVAEELFVVGDTLTEDGRIGKVTDLQGIVSVKPAAAQRWTPLDRLLPVHPGDWLRTDVRGANAARVRLVGQADVTLGPGSSAELSTPRRIRVAEGEIKVVATPTTPLELLGPGGEKISVNGTQLYRVANEKLVRVQQEPLWLRAFEGRTNNESIGSLVAKVDGRDVPLSVGFHKVTVDVSDQIARTVIEESFVNRTSAVLEGVFYFPLPADASISGFGMWIGDKLVEADVVEKQRAREIYETILREQRDPALLEWSGGNIFKARVFPIPGHSEKRITITYTQVLPRKGNQYRYQYGLQSEMLKQHPLRELSITVNLNSVVPLAGVTCPTHPARITQSPHSGRVEFAAQEHTPSRDFEVVVEVDRTQSPVVLIPHRRGSDGYFMVQLTPPGPGGPWQRELLPDGEPIELLILADTSASLDASARRLQGQLVAAMLGALSAKDRFNLAVCDVDARWVFDGPLPAEAKNIAAARQVLADRVSLGWSDLDKAFAAALARCGPKTRVVYLGDGIITTGDADAVAFGKRLRRMYEERFKVPLAAGQPVPGVPLAAGQPVPFYAVALGSSYEQVVLKAIASLGGGSMRQIAGDRGPQAVARELMEEMVEPALRDLKVEFRNLRTGRVYPEDLPNLPPGSQQILLGRYLPEGADQTGEVIVTGTLAGKPVRFSHRVSLKDAEQGNSFIPRLWARMHLDWLLQQGSSQAIQDEIIALSEEYNIITPYTSLLVLESDADRERFKVKTRFRIRDGEEIFARARDNVNYDLTRQQMRLAGTWRIGLRRSVLQQLQTLGRDPGRFQDTRERYTWGRMAGFGGAFPSSGPITSVSYGSSRFQFNGQAKDLYSWGNFSGEGDSPQRALSLKESKAGGDFDMEGSAPSDRRSGGEGLEEIALESLGRELADNRPFEPSGDKKQFGEGDYDSFAATPISSQPFPVGDFVMTVDGLAAKESRFNMGWPVSLSASRPEASPSPLFRGGLVTSGNAKYSWYQGSGWLNSIFPQLPPPPSKEKEPKKRWPAEARKLAESLLRTETLARLERGLRIERRSEQFDPRWGELTSRSEVLALVSPAGWVVRFVGDHQQTTLAWCDAQQRGVLWAAFQLGRVRAATPADLRDLPVDLSGYVLHSIERTFSTYRPELRPQGNDRVLLVLSHPSNRGFEIHVLVDTARRAILSTENRQDGKVTSATRFGDFVEAAGAWWAGRIESFDDENRRTSVLTQKLQPLADAQFDAQRKAELAGRDQALLLREPLPTLAGARRAVAAGKATFEDHLVLMLYYEQSQQWAREWEHFEKAEPLAAGKPGVRWARGLLLNASRRRDDLKQWISQEAGRLARPRVAGQSPANEPFLADFLLGQASGALEANEMLALLDALRPAFEGQPTHLQGMKPWLDRRAQHLEQTGQWEEALAVQKQLAERYPHDANVQQIVARRLATLGQYEAAYEWIRRVLAPPARWLPYEEEQLRGAVLDLLEGQGRYPEAADYLKAWIAANPKTETPYRRYLGTLVRADRLEEADATIAAWINAARVVEKVPQKLPQEAIFRLRAAVSQALSQGYRFSANRLDPRWLDPLADLVLSCAGNNVYYEVAGEVMNHGLFRQTDACRRVRRTVTKMLRDEPDKLSPEQIRQFIPWILANDPAVEPELWAKILAALRRRWSAQSDPEIKHQLGATLVQALSAQAKPEEVIEFLRVRWQQGPEQYRAGYARELFDRLLGMPWSEAGENEAFSLLEKLSDDEQPAQRLVAAVGALHRLTDRTVQARFAARMKAVEHQEKLTRTELAAKREESLRLAREGFADALRLHNRKAPAELAGWVTIERMYLDVLAGRNLQKVEEECWEFLGERPRKLSAEDLQRQLDSVLQNRYLVTLLNLCARKTARPATVERALAYLDRAIAAEPEDLSWKLLRMQLLVALDRPKDLQKILRVWIAAADPSSPWRQPLAYLMAEQGRLDEAIKLFEAIRAEEGLGPTDHRALANWYMAAGRRELYERAMIDSYRTVDDWRLSDWLRRKLNPWQRSGVPLPSELDKEVLLVFAALFEKAGQPQQHLRQLQEFYNAARDFRLLASGADAVVGHTAGRVYPFLESMGPVLSSVQDEATVDALVEHVGKVRQRAKTPVDHRALDLLEVLIERRAAEMRNQPGPHADRAVAAMGRAGKRQWSPGEPRLMADFLARLGRISHPKLAEEQVRLLEDLHRQSAPGTIDRLHVATCLARCRSDYGQRARAIDLLENALGEYLPTVGGTLPAAANPAMDQLVRFLEMDRHFARGEKLLLAQLARPANRRQGFWLVERLYRLYNEALQGDGDVSLGSGQTLYQAVNRRVQAEMSTTDHNHRSVLVAQLTTIYRTAKAKALAGVVDDLRQFAFKRVPQILTRHEGPDDSIVRNTAQALYDLASPRDGLAFYVERIENEPRWRHLTGDDVWSRSAHSIAEWRTKAGELGDLDARLLKIVAAELRRDLESRQQRNRAIYTVDHNFFWAQKREAFARVAEEVLAEHKQSSAAVVYVAEYLHWGLGRYRRAIDVLLDAHKREVLDESGQSRLVDLLQRRSGPLSDEELDRQFAESIPILEPLVQRRPDNVQYRVWLMAAYFNTKQKDKLLSLLRETDAYFHKENRWQEGVMAALANACVSFELNQQAVAYYKELIPLHQRTQPNRGIGNGTLSGYYGNLARAYSGLGQTAEAVDAASGAIVSWGPTHSQRSHALDRLKQVLRESPDLDGYVAQLDKEAAKTGLQNPIVRKAAGMAYMDKNEPAKAIVQLELACELVPNDAQTYQTLVAAYDATRDKQGAIRLILRQTGLARRDIKLYDDLARRYESSGQESQAERARTSIVEMLPSESESHTLLAEIRQRQDRWPEAIVQWEQVARIRALEPTGLLQLAQAQVHQKQWDAAQATLRKVDVRGWPSRFGDVHNQVRDLEQQIESGRKSEERVKN